MHYPSILHAPTPETGYRTITSNNTGSLPLKVQTLQDLMQNNENNSPHRHAYCEAVFIVKATGQYCLDLQHHQLREKTIYFTSPGQLHQLELQPGSNGYVLSFCPEALCVSSANLSKPFYTPAFSNFFFGGFVKQIDQHATDELINLFCYMFKEYSGTGILRDEMLTGLLGVFLQYLEKLPGSVDMPSMKSGRIRLINAFYIRLEKSFQRNKMVHDYAAEMCLSANYLNHIIKDATGFSASHHIRQRKILEAKRYAVHSTASMKEIAYLLGFTDIAYFSKYFKQAAGITFSKYRELHTASRALSGSVLHAKQTD